MIPVKMSVLMSVPISIAATKNRRIALTAFSDNTFDVEKISGKISNGAFIRISLKA
jgi:hypothetical protein